MQLHAGSNPEYLYIENAGTESEGSDYIEWT